MSNLQSYPVSTSFSCLFEISHVSLNVSTKDLWNWPEMQLNWAQWLQCHQFLLLLPCHLTHSWRPTTQHQSPVSVRKRCCWKPREGRRIPVFVTERALNRKFWVTPGESRVCHKSIYTSLPNLFIPTAEYNHPSSVRKSPLRNLNLPVPLASPWSRQLGSSFVSTVALAYKSRQSGLLKGLGVNAWTRSIRLFMTQWKLSILLNAANLPFLQHFLKLSALSTTAQVIKTLFRDTNWGTLPVRMHKS